MSWRLDLSLAEPRAHHLTLDDELLAKAREGSGITERSVLLHEGLRLIVQRDAARRLMLLGGTDRATVAPRPAR